MLFYSTCQCGANKHRYQQWCQKDFYVFCDEACIARSIRSKAKGGRFGGQYQKTENIANYYYSSMTQ
jgi:hypothetical protein